jgi:hypothetical protein
MEKIVLNDIIGLSTYEKMREEYRRRIIELKKERRIALGNKVSVLFENRDTVLFQIQEMLRTEKITDLDKIKEEVNVYNDLIPGPGELSATLFLEIEAQDRLREELLKFLGIDERVFLKIGDQHSVHAHFEEGHSKEDKISAVQYIRFPLTPEQIKALSVNHLPARLIIDHPNYQAAAEIGPQTRARLLEDLGRQP